MRIKKNQGHEYGVARPCVVENTCKCGVIEMRTQTTSNMICSGCKHEKLREYRVKNNDILRAKKREYYAKHRLDILKSKKSMSQSPAQS